MAPASLRQLAEGFVRGESVHEQLGPVLVSTVSRVVLSPPPGFAHVELERAAGAVFALHVWPDVPQRIDVGVEAVRLPRFTPRDPVALQLALPEGLAVFEVAAEGATAVHAYRFGANSFSGAITSEAHLIALFEYVTGSGFTLEAVERTIGRATEQEKGHLLLAPRPGANARRAVLELSKGLPHGLVLDFERSIDVDMGALRGRYGAEEWFIFGGPQAFRHSYTFHMPDRASLILGSRRRIEGMRLSVTDLIVRRGRTEAPISPEGPRARPGAVLAPERVFAIVAAFFEHGLDEAGACALLGDPIRSGAGRVRLAPRDPALDGVVLEFGADRATIEIELAATGAPEPALLEPLFGASRPVPPPHAQASPAQRFHLRHAHHLGYLLVQPERLTICRMAESACLGDFVRPEDLLAVIFRHLDEPGLTFDTLCPLIGQPAPREVDIGDGVHSVDVIPYAGSNVDRARVCYRIDDRTINRIEISLHASRAVDCSAIAARTPQITGPNVGLLKYDMIQYSARCPTSDFLGIVLLNTNDRREGSMKLVRSIILDKVRPGQPNRFEKIG